MPTATYNLPYIEDSEGSPEVPWREAMDIIDANMAGGGAGTPVILEGRSGGQDIRGGTGSGETLTLQSTAHATKGKIYFGSGSVFDDATECMGLRKTSPTALLHFGPQTNTKAAMKFDTGSLLTTPEAGTIEHDSEFHMTESDAVRRYFVLAEANTVTTAGAPYTNAGYIVVNIHGVDRKVMVTTG